ncbi:AI-2E family transporter [Paracoccus siganidrum]|uniref:AI-2E family transporter n=1 Tax=Paracoccus siganidrum TaxID=1276757 RepID=A0A418ZYM2_9RHOB|nr:AI-2E family transporter [Paracoccus siganidrum]RJL05594.1 AI-2E family transporter [Paracoccus siganidrum]RMC31124.1 AI-2E family transporter [Paracoccus siganidrum]
MSDAQNSPAGTAGPDESHGPLAPSARPRSPRPLVTDISAARWLLFGVLAASIYFFHGFLIPILAATIIAVASWPLRARLVAETGIGPTAAAAVLVLAIMCLLVVPLSLALLYAIAELQSWVVWAIEVNSLGAPAPEWMREIPRAGAWLDEQWSTYIGRPGAISELIHAISGSSIASVYRGVLTAGAITFHVALNILFTLVALFVFYRDGEKIVAQVDRAGKRILAGRWQRLSRVVPATISATVTGMTLIAIGEGVILGVAYWIAGVPSPIVFGVITGVLALIPGGAPLSFSLISIYLVFSGSVFAGVGLFLWGAIELFIVDKTIRPMLVGGPVKLPFLPTFFGLIGGVKTMGIVGLFVGPVLMALLVSIWREWQREIAEAEGEILPSPKP